MILPLVASEQAASSLFWGARPPDDSDFLSFDPLALDYLGQQVGLWLFPFFTTRTDRAQYYAVVLYGLFLADEVTSGVASDEERVALFERWERFWALAVLESHGGKLGRGDPDAFRGIRGASRWWKPGDGPLPLDFPLISRQQELGGLGAYLSSLRDYKLVLAGTLRPTPLAREIIMSLWDEPDSNARHSSYDAFADAALDPQRAHIERKISGVTLAEIGRRTRLTSLVQRSRTRQQERLARILLDEGPAPTPRLAELVQQATRAQEMATEPFLEGALAGRWGTLEPSLHALLHFALAFGQASRTTLDAFHALYSAVIDGGWVVDLTHVLPTVFTVDRLAQLQQVSAAVLDDPMSARLRALPVHASGFVQLLTTLRAAGADEAFAALLRYHAAVQAERRSGPGWLRLQGGKLVVDMATYTGHLSDAPFPAFKLPAVRRLLADLGRLA